MCGVFGFVSSGEGRLNLAALKRIARVTESRGPHAFGFAWIDGRGRLHCFKQTGRITDSLALLGMAAGARMLIGHCRYATHGDYRQNINNHPHAADGGWIVQELVDPPTERLPCLHGTDLVFGDVVSMTCPFLIEGHIAASVGRTATPRSASRVQASAGRKLSVAGIRTAFCVG